MITMILQGGLGNQMFQYAMGYSQAKRLNVPLQLEISRLMKDPLRQYNLSLFHGVNELLVYGRMEPNVEERSMPYSAALVASIKDGDVIGRNYQSEKYFANVEWDLRERFVPRKAMPPFFYEHALKQIIAAGRASTMIGIRRTDYVQKQDYHGVLSMEYYRAAIEQVRVKIGMDPVLFVFSDEPDWCKQNLKFPYETHVLGTYDFTTSTRLGREDADMTLMSACRNAVIANSTYHWWGVWLGDALKNKFVIGPKQWFTTTKEDPRDIMPERWVKL